MVATLERQQEQQVQDRWEAVITGFGKVFESHHPNNLGYRVQNIYFDIPTFDKDPNFKICVPTSQARMFEKGQRIAVMVSPYGKWQLLPGQKPEAVRQAYKAKFSGPSKPKTKVAIASPAGGDKLTQASADYQRCIAEAKEIISTLDIRPEEWPSEVLSVATSLFQSLKTA